MARPREFDTDLALNQMRDIFWMSGFEGSSLSTLVSATGVHKASLYAAFGTKQDIFCKALVNYEQIHIRACIDMMAKLGGRKALEALLMAPVEAVSNGDRRGCFLCNSSGDYASLDKAAAAIVDRGQDMMLDAIGKALEEADIMHVQPGEVLAIYFGQRVLSRSGMAPQAIKQIARSVIDRL